MLFWAGCAKRNSFPLFFVFFWHCGNFFFTKKLSSFQIVEKSWSKECVGTEYWEIVLCWFCDTRGLRFPGGTSKFVSCWHYFHDSFIIFRKTDSLCNKKFPPSLDEFWTEKIYFRGLALIMESGGAKVKEGGDPRLFSPHDWWTTFRTKNQMKFAKRWLTIIWREHFAERVFAN